MKLQILSDIHSEFHKSQADFWESLVQPADILILAGDIHVGRDNLVRCLRHFSRRYPAVIFVPGNHEYYNGLAYGAFRSPEFKDKLPMNVFVLDTETLLLEGKSFIGATLWSDPPEEFKQQVTRCIPDFARMKDNDFLSHKARYQQDKAYILQKLEEYENPVVITHFVPNLDLTHPKWFLDPTSRQLNRYFSGDIDLNNCPKCTWIYGHTHDPLQTTRNNVTLICNPHGYPYESKSPYTPVFHAT